MNKELFVEKALQGGASMTVEGLEPKNGYMVGLDGFERIIPKNEFTVDSVDEFLKERPLKEGEFLGAWEDNGNIVLDVSVNPLHLREAVGLGLLNYQTAIYDVIGNKSWFIDRCIDSLYEQE